MVSVCVCVGGGGGSLIGVVRDVCVHAWEGAVESHRRKATRERKRGALLLLMAPTHPHTHTQRHA